MKLNRERTRYIQLITSVSNCVKHTFLKHATLSFTKIKEFFFIVNFNFITTLPLLMKEKKKQ